MLGFEPKAARYTWTAAVVLLLIAAVYLIRDTVVVFVVALLFAYLLYPLMDLIDRYLPSRTRTPALALTWILTIGVLVTFGVLLGTVVTDQATKLAAQAPAFLKSMSGEAPARGPAAVSSLRAQVGSIIENQLREHYNQIASEAPKVSLQVLSASRNLIYLIIIPILSFFILRDGRSIRDSFLEMLDSERAVADEILTDLHTLLLQYMRALLLLCCTVFVVYSIVLSIMRTPYSILLAAIAFPMEFIPLVGPLVSAVVIIAVSFLAGYPHVLWVVIFLGVFRIFQDYILSPRLMGRGVELHPLMVIFGVFAGAEIGGVAGVFLSVPLLAIIRLVYRRLNRVRARRLRAT